MVEVAELVDLEAKKYGPEQHDRRQPDHGQLLGAALHPIKGQHHGQRAHQQHEGADGRERNVEDFLGEGPGQALPLVDHVGRDQRAEEQALRPDERPESELPRSEPGRRVVMLVVSESGV